jgi:head-tail adaptor
MSYASMVNKAGTTVTIKRKVETEDGYGGQTLTWAVMYRSVPARFETTAGRVLGTVYDKATSLPEYFVHIAGTYDIKEDDRIYMTDGRAFGVKKVHAFAEQGYQVKLDVTEIGRNEA